MKFVEGLSWKQVKERAKAENKFIFVELFATWCGPCQYMSNEVFPWNRLASPSIKISLASESKWTPPKRTMLLSKVGMLMPVLFLMSTISNLFQLFDFQSERRSCTPDCWRKRCT
ncbi:thioredoxin domain-containing protein [Sphingobacterium sp. E70]|uniref:thioredoxin domain-containing protein n=1 Tax=Sphingobacterium sp. E70 TaxID=2853439 RepID=UPI00211CC245|nr:thioredoxin domain-containing protein [Sphingobacterium sp. E70]ULT27695.1 thioredoxin domain-containing protein [Sphingobacterium sp. E70]